uniref:B-cell receptor CD22-like n=1 Tax=Lepisosteus oculatus TaxID=7918 RepID=W5MCS0_LEPOC
AIVFNGTVMMSEIVIAGVYGSDWAVSYPRRTICTVRGSSVIIRCSYNYPKEFTVHSQSVQHKVTTVMWCKTNTTCNENISIYNSDNEPFRQKIVYLGNKQKNCTLMINDVEEIDNGRYKFRFQTNNPGGQWTGNPGVTLTVSGKVVLFSQFNTIIFSHINLKHIQQEYNYLISFLVNARNMLIAVYSFSHNYSIALYICCISIVHICMYDFALNCSRSTPWKVKANSTRKKDTFKEGDSVTLMCHTGSCFPTTTELTWFKNGQPISNRQTTANTLHFNSVSYEDYGNYSCASKANTSISSPQFSLDVKYSPKSTSVSVSPSGQILEGSSVTLTCRSNANPPVKNYIWFKMSSAGVQETGQGQNLTLAEVSSGDSGHYFCGAQNKHGAENSTAVVLAVAAKQNPAVLPVVLVVILLSISALVSYIC